MTRRLEETNVDVTIRTLAKRCAVSARTIRYYERKGLVYPDQRNRAGYRVCSEDTLRRIRFIRHVQENRLFTVRGIADLLALLIDSTADCDAVRRAAISKVGELTERIGQLETITSTLTALARRCAESAEEDGCPVLTAFETTDEQINGTS